MSINNRKKITGDRAEEINKLEVGDEISVSTTDLHSYTVKIDEINPNYGRQSKTLHGVIKNYRGLMGCVRACILIQRNKCFIMIDIDSVIREEDNWESIVSQMY